MFLIISPAKKLASQTVFTGETSAIAFKKKTAELVGLLKNKSKKDLAQMMSISPALAALNHERYQSFDPSRYRAANASPAVLLFQGDVYKYLKADTFTPKELQYAQNHLGILSGLYGLLSPLDQIQPYRLEMGTTLANSAGDTLYDFWKDTVTAALNQQLAHTKSRYLINLASKEYFSVIDPNAIDADILTIAFKEWKNGQLKTLGMNAKRARGAMARFLIKNQYKTKKGIQHFTDLGYLYCAQESSANELVFIRD